MPEKIVMYKLKDGRTVASRAEAIREEMKADVISKLMLGLAGKGSVTPELEAAIGIVVNSIINAGWRPPAKIYKKVAAPAAAK